MPAAEPAVHDEPVYDSEELQRKMSSLLDKLRYSADRPVGRPYAHVPADSAAYQDIRDVLQDLDIE